MIGSDFAGWAGCNIGSFVTYESESLTRMSLPGQGLAPEMLASLRALMPEMSFRSTSEITVTLAERHPDRLVLEILSRLTFDGQTQETRRREALPALPPPEEPVQETFREEDGEGGYAEVAKVGWNQIFKDAVPKVGEETLEIAGRTLPCRRVEKSADEPMGRISLTTWHSDQVPGGCVRSVVLMSGSSDQTVTTQVRAFERK
ncbi:MAG: hypothetical protein HY293_10575 [Planctomycetes bacterium]|nr:hypothetical protein [Planctomycetota bacterium]